MHCRALLGIALEAEPAAATTLTLPSATTGTLLSVAAATGTVSLGAMPDGSNRSGLR